MKTKFGNAILNNKGYYQIKSRKEGNHNKYLHRLIFEEFYGEIPNGYHVHHKDENPSNNCILNLQLVKADNHRTIHHKGRRLTDEHKLKISNSLSNSNDNPFRVYKKKRKDCKQGFSWEYSYYEKGKRRYISSVNLQTLKDKVIAKGLLWHESNTTETAGRTV